MDRLHQIADELIRLYRRQLTLWCSAKWTANWKWWSLPSLPQSG